MAQWWELAIPAGSALIGTLIGAGSQLVLRRVRSTFVEAARQDLGVT